MDDVPRGILVGVAGRTDSAAAVRYAVAEARRTGRPVDLLHVVHPGLAGRHADPAAREPVLRAGRQVLDEVADEAGRLPGPQVPVTTQLVVGHAAAALTDAAATAGMVVLQPERLGRLHDVATYSVTNSVAGHAVRPVVAVPTGWTGEDEPDVVSVGVDEVGGSGRLVQAAFEEAQSRGATLRVLHAWQYSEAYDDLVFSGGGLDRRSAEVADGIRQELEPWTSKFSGVAVDVVVVHGRAADQLARASRSSALLVVGRHRTGLRPGHHLGSIVRAVLRESRCPVMVVDPIDRAWVSEDV